MLTLEGSRRFRKSRNVGCYLGVRPGRRNSGPSEPRPHISQVGNWAACGRNIAISLTSVARLGTTILDIPLSTTMETGISTCCCT
jgi:transposase